MTDFTKADVVAKAQRYLDAVRERPCEYGHLECAKENGGACGNEVEALFWADEE